MNYWMKIQIIINDRQHPKHPLRYFVDTLRYRNILKIDNNIIHAMRVYITKLQPASITVIMRKVREMNHRYKRELWEARQ